MANQQHVDILKSGVVNWNKWRKENPEIIPNLINAELQNVDLSEAKLRHAVLFDANLEGANLTRADLSVADLFKANLSGAILDNAFLIKANLSVAKLTNASSIKAEYGLVNMMSASLADTDLSDSIIGGVNFAWTNLSRTNFSGANLGETSFVHSIFDKTNFRGAVLFRTSFVDVDLKGALDLETILHQSPSSIDIDTLYKSGASIPDKFLEGIGLSREEVENIKPIYGKRYACFISYAEADEEFTKKLYLDLKSHNVKCWRWREDAKEGHNLADSISNAIDLHDKVIVVCSSASLNSSPVIREIERAIQKEDATKAEVLFPIRIDDYVLHEWQHPRKPDIVSKKITDFRNWKDEGEYKTMLTSLLKALNKT